ncbi:MAG: MFS transporter [Nocardioides sp.]
MRFVDGVFLGGEYTAATPLAFEHCPREARGLFGGLLMGAYAAAYAVVSAIVLVLLTVMPGASYTSWGWRIPFVAGGCIGFVFLAYRARIPESGMWQATVKETNPLRTVLRGRVRRDLAQVLVLMTGLWLVATSVVTVMPRILATELGMSSRWVTAVLLVSQVFVFAGFVTTGVLSQVWGRRRVLIRGAAVAGTAGLASYGLVLTHEAGATMLVVLVVLTQLLVLSVWVRSCRTATSASRPPSARPASGWLTAWASCRRASTRSTWPVWAG